MKQNIEEQQKIVLRKIFVQLQINESIRCVLLADFPSQWASALSLIIKEIFPNYIQERLLITHCDQYFSRFGNEGLYFPGVVLIDALEYSAQVTFSELKSILYSAPEKKLVVMADAASATWSPPNHMGVVKVVRIREEITAVLETFGIDYSSDREALVNSLYRDDSALLTHSEKIIPRYTLDQLVLRDSTKQNFMETLNVARNKIKDSYESGWRERHQKGHNVVLVFNGPSGTGKTMAAEVIAKELGYLLYRIDYSSIQSKYVGEAEKNLKSIFEAARGVPGILLFDEGDAIFASRTNNDSDSSSTSRYANAEVNFLLQELEKFEGIIIISTNLEKNMDDAFMRRFTRVVSFPFPPAEVRALLWKTLAPPRMTFEGDIDFDVLGSLSLSGGDIRNALAEACLIPRARGDRAVTMIDLLWAAKRECQKRKLNFPGETTGKGIPIELLELVGVGLQDEAKLYAIGADPHQSKHVWNRAHRLSDTAGKETFAMKERKRADGAYLRKVISLTAEKDLLASLSYRNEFEEHRFIILQSFLALNPSPQNRLPFP